MLTQELLKELVHYNSETGIFTWKYREPHNFKSLINISQWNSRCAGKYCGSKDKNGYITLRINGKFCMSHRMAWLYFYGEHPSTHIDHIDGDTGNNCINNLRLATGNLNQRNRSLFKTNKSGCHGVTWHKKDKKWHAKINNDAGDVVHLGCFSEAKDAINARKAAELEYGYHKNHGRSKVDRSSCNTLKHSE